MGRGFFLGGEKRAVKCRCGPYRVRRVLFVPPCRVFERVDPVRGRVRRARQQGGQRFEFRGNVAAFSQF